MLQSWLHCRMYASTVRHERTFDSDWCADLGCYKAALEASINGDHPAVLFFHTFSIWMDNRNQTNCQSCRGSIPAFKTNFTSATSLDWKDVQKKATAGQKYPQHCLMNHKYWSLVGFEECICSEEMSVKWVPERHALANRKTPTGQALQQAATLLW